MSSYRMSDEFAQNAPLKMTPYLLLRLLGLQQRVPMSNGLAWISQHLVPVVPAKSLSVASHPHHTNDLIMTYPVATHTDCINTPHLSRHDSSHIKLLLLTASGAFCNERRHKSEPGRHADWYSESAAGCLCETKWLVPGRPSKEDLCCSVMLIHVILGGLPQPFKILAWEQRRRKTREFHTSTCSLTLKYIYSVTFNSHVLILSAVRVLSLPWYSFIYWHSMCTRETAVQLSQMLWFYRWIKILSLTVTLWFFHRMEKLEGICDIFFWIFSSLS